MNSKTSYGTSDSLGRFTAPKDGVAINPQNVRDLAPEVLDGNGRLRILPMSFWAETTPTERGLFGNLHGYYAFPTTELVEYLQEVIGDRKAIEIGAGNGVLAEALDIPATDNFQQRMPEYNAYYKSLGQAIVPYGPNVERLDAREAVRKYRPQVVIGCWVTHKYDPKRHLAGGNEIGVKEEHLLERVETYVHVGNEQVHKNKAILKREHQAVHADWLFSRSLNATPDVIYVWDTRK